eukprot:scaffold213_cov245-Pinguiococcus_pyrenoidosus.AAC.15
MDSLQMRGVAVEVTDAIVRGSTSAHTPQDSLGASTDLFPLALGYDLTHQVKPRRGRKQPDENLVVLEVTRKRGLLRRGFSFAGSSTFPKLNTVKKSALRGPRDSSLRSRWDPLGGIASVAFSDGGSEAGLSELPALRPSGPKGAEVAAMTRWDHFSAEGPGTRAVLGIREALDLCGWDTS